MIGAPVLEVDVGLPLGDLTVAGRFQAPAGITVLFGRSGAGKTSLIDMIAGLRRPRRGRIALAGQVLFDAEAGIDLKPERRRVGYVFQQARLFPHLSVAGNLRFGFARRRPGAAGLDRAVALLGLEGLLARRPHTLSGGEAQRVAIARALLSDPDLILMDEPLGGLDAPRREEIMSHLEAMRAAGGPPILYVSHAIDEIVRLADWLVVVERGAVLADGPIGELTTRLDLAPLIAEWDAGAVVEAEVAAHDDGDHLTRLAIGARDLWIARLERPVGARLRLRIRARDVSLAKVRPEQFSVLNVLPATVLELRPFGEAQQDVLLDAGARLWARVTSRSARDLALAPGAPVFAVIKAVALDRPAPGAAS